MTIGKILIFSQKQRELIKALFAVELVFREADYASMCWLTEAAGLIWISGSNKPVCLAC